MTKIYHDALTNMLHPATFYQNTAILTGIGGDELSISYENQENLYSKYDPQLQYYDYINYLHLLKETDEILPLPTPYINFSSITSAQARSPVFLRKGLWPINPLCCPLIV